MHVIEKDIRRWSKEVLEIPSPELNNLPPCPYAKQVWKNNTYKFDINNKFDTLKSCVNKFVKGQYSNYQIVIWTSYEYPASQQYFEGYLEGYNESLAIAGKDVYLMGFHPDFDAEEAELAFLNRDYEQEEENEYAMVFVQKLSEVNKASEDLEKKDYYKNFSTQIYETLILDRRRLQNGYES